METVFVILAAYLLALAIGAAVGALIANILDIH